MTAPRKTSLAGQIALTAFVLAAAMPRPAAAQVTITSVVTGTAPSDSANADIQNALNFLATDFAPNTGTTAFHMTASITLTDLKYSSGGGYALGGSSAGSDSFQTHSDVLYINPLDRYLYGANSTVDTSGNYADFTIELNNNSQVPWNYTLSTPLPGSISLASVLYHESIHSMGFAAFNQEDGSYDFNGSNGSNGYGPLDPTLWDTKLYDGTTNQSFITDTVAQRQAVMVSGDGNGSNSKLFFAGANALSIIGGKGVGMYAPSTYRSGSSDGSHIASDQPDGGGLLYYATSGGTYDTPSPLELAMMQDIGWKTTNGNASAAPEPGQIAVLSLAAFGILGLTLRARKRKMGAV